MRKTYCEASMKIMDVNAAEDASPFSNSNQSFGNIENLKENLAPANYGTLELNQFVLDGSKEVFTEEVTDISYMSAYTSGENCTFAENPTVEIQFSEAHTSIGITLTFAEDYPTKIALTWYSLNGSKIIRKEFSPDALVYECMYQVENYGRLVIEFIETRLPYQYARLQYVMYGSELSFKQSAITSASVVEEIDVISATLSINTAKISIMDADNEFDISNNDGMWKSVQKTQEVDLTEYIDDNPIPVGTFFIDEKSFSDNIASFTLIDSIGLMDGYTFSDGEMYSNTPAGEIMESIFAAAKITKYDIAEDVYNIPLSGTIYIQTCREALQMICFVCGAVADDSRSDTVKVYMPDKYISHTIPISRKFNGSSKVELSDYVSGVSIECNKYALQDESEEIYNDTLSAGTTRIEFSNPYLPESITASVGKILSVMPHYMIISLDSTQECVITGRKYESTTFTYQKSVDNLDAGETENVKSFGTFTVFNADKIKEKAETLLNYYNLRKSVSLKYILESEKSGNWVNINDKLGNLSTTMIESQSIDLTGGFIATSDCIGYSSVVSENYFTGNELYAGAGGII